MSFVVLSFALHQPQRTQGTQKEEVSELHPLSAGEIDISTLDVSANKLHPQPVSHVDALVSLSQQSFDARLQHANKGSLRGRSGDHARRTLRRSDGSSQPPPFVSTSRAPLSARHLPFRCSSGNGRQFVVRIRSRSAGKHSFDQPLRDEIGEAPVGSRRVGVVLHREAKVSLLRISWPLQNIFARANQLDHGQRQIGKVIGISGLALEQKIIERLGIGIRQEAFPRAQQRVAQCGPSAREFSRCGAETILSPACGPRRRWPRS